MDKKTPRFLEIARNNQFEFTPEFMDFIEENGHIYEAFDKAAMEVIAAGFRHYSARTIIHVLRHHSAISQAGEWKINNNVSPYLARLFALVHPVHADLFEFRVAKAVYRTRSAGAYAAA